MTMKPFFIICIVSICCCAAVFSSCARPVSIEHTEIALGTYVKTIVITEKQNRDKAQTTIEELYNLLFTFEGVFDYRTQEGELNRFNTGEVLYRNDHIPLFELIMESIEYAELTDGYFEPTILPLMKVWGFDTNAPHIPEPEVLAETLDRVDYTQLSISHDRIRKPEYIQLDLSGIAKGKLVDIASDLLRDADFSDFLVDAGGDIYASGRNLSRKKWRVAIQDPLHRDKYMGILEISEAAIVTSGDYEHFFMVQEKRYSHLLNPYTGYPDSDIRGVSVIAHEAAFADAIATAVFTMGSREGYQFLLDAGIEGYIVYGDQPESLSTPHFWD